MRENVRNNNASLAAGDNASQTDESLLIIQKKQQHRYL